MPWIWGRVCWRTPTTAWLWCRSSSAILLKARDLLCGQGRGQIGIWSISETYVDLKWFELSPLPRENFDTLTLRVLEGSPWNLALRTSFDQPLRLRPGRAIEHHRTLSQWQRHTVTTCFPTRCFFPGGNRGVNEQCYIIEQRLYRGVQSTGVTVVTLWCRQGVTCTVVIDSFARFSRRCCEQCCTRRTRCIPDASCSILAQWVQWKGSTDPGQYKHLTFLTHSRTKFFNVTCLK